MPYVIDLIIAGIMLLAIVVSAKRGFVRIIMETVGFILAVWIIFTIHTPLANLTYDKMVAPAIHQAVSDTAHGTTEEITSKVWESLPSYVKGNAIFPGVSEETVSKTVEKSILSGKDTAEQISESLIKPAAVQLLSLIYSLVLMTVFMIVVRIVARALNRVFSFRLVGKINRILGALVGIVRGIITAIAFSLILSLLVSVTDGFWIFTPETLAESRFMSMLSDFRIVL